MRSFWLILFLIFLAGPVCARDCQDYTRAEVEAQVADYATRFDPPIGYHFAHGGYDFFYWYMGNSYRFQGDKLIDCVRWGDFWHLVQHPDYPWLVGIADLGAGAKIYDILTGEWLILRHKDFSQVAAGYHDSCMYVFTTAAGFTFKTLGYDDPRQTNTGQAMQLWAEISIPLPLSLRGFGGTEE